MPVKKGNFVEERRSEMSQWTHVLGVVRFDSINKLALPELFNKDEITVSEANQVYRLFVSSNLPSGSEGPIEVNTILTNRGPTVLITGDLRDFGKEDMLEILDWLNDLGRKFYKAVIGNQSVMMIRDAAVRCDVEYDDSVYLITCNKDDDAFPLSVPFTLEVFKKGERK